MERVKPIELVLLDARLAISETLFPASLLAGIEEMGQAETLPSQSVPPRAPLNRIKSRS